MLETERGKVRTYDELTPEEQEQAVEKATNLLLEIIVEGGIRFNDELNGDDLQARIDAAWEKANQMQTPWFAHEYIMGTCADEIRGMARCDAEDAIYPEGVQVIYLSRSE